MISKSKKNKKPIYMHTVKVHFPWWLKWVERFVWIDLKKHELPGLKGHSAELIKGDLE